MSFECDGPGLQEGQSKSGVGILEMLNGLFILNLIQDAAVMFAIKFGQTAVILKDLRLT